jgi:geranylgeranyl pyrophosphate synthase
LSAFEERLRQYQRRVEHALDRCLPATAEPPQRLHEAMRYATLDGGKRVRAALVYAAGEALGASVPLLDAPACAVELVHAYSLVHDDLPCMDDDDLRRGKPTCHRTYGEAAALLAGDALQTLAFQILAEDAALAVLAPAKRLQMIATLAAAAGSSGMAGGQAIDLAAVGKPMNADQLQEMHTRKTGALIHGSVMLGALATGNGTPAHLAALDRFGRVVGLAFQIVDDILDVEGDTQTLGKTARADAARNKPTYPAVLGMAAARQRARELHKEALESLAPFGDNGQILAALASFILERRQ